MLKTHLSLTLLFAITAAFALGLAIETASAQSKKPTGASGKHTACLTKARAENPNRADGHARQAAYNRCMGR